jgi:hypothetical protein
MLALLLLGGCMNTPCTNTTQTIWEPEVAAWCDHQPVWQESPTRRHLRVEFKEKDAAIISVTTYFDGAPVSSVDSVLNTRTHKVRLLGMFPEGMHGKMLKVEILVAFKGRVFRVPVYCTVSNPI